jgi:acyl homoserine lactone synthase
VSLVAITNQRLQTGLFLGLARYRRKVFIERLSWELHGCGDSRPRQTERDDAVEVVLYSDDAAITGRARLLPTKRPYRFGDVCPELFHDGRLPLDEVWELSRFVAVDFSQTSATPFSCSVLSAPVAAALLRKTVALAAERGAQRLVTVSALGIERLMRSAGLKPHRAGPPVMLNGKPSFACWIDI